MDREQTIWRRMLLGLGVVCRGACPGQVGRRLLWSLFVWLFALQAQAAATPVLSITPITWNVIGLDSNVVTDGPNIFPIGARVCNVGTTTATGVTAQFVFTGTRNTNINLQALNSVKLDDLPAGSAPPAANTISSVPANCQDAYFNIVVTRTSAAYNTTQGYYIEASATGATSVRTPASRELYVEKLVSQGRNAVVSFTGPASASVGEVIQLTLRADTSTNGYEQLENYPVLPNSVFQVLNVTTTYSAPAGAVSSSAYNDACQWQSDPALANYRSCLGTGKVGGTMTSVYTVRVISGSADRVFNVIYDFSGSSYHYNSDYNTGAKQQTPLTITATAPDLTLTKTHTGIFTVGQPASFTFTVRSANAGAFGKTTVTDTLPTGLSLPDGPVTLGGVNAVNWTCSSLSNRITCTSTNTSTSTPLIVAGGSSTFTVTGIGVTASAAPSVTNTASVSNPNEAATTTGNNTATDTVTVNVPPTAVNDSASTAQATAVTLNVVLNDTDSSPGTVSAATVDLDPATTGIQTTFTVTGRGTFTVNTSGVVTFTPVSGFSGNASTSYTVQDNQGASSNTATITVTVLPRAVNDTASTARNQAVNVSVLSNDLGTGFTAAGVLFPSTGQPTGSVITNGGKTLTNGDGIYAVQANGTVTFTPTANYAGTASPVTYQTTDAAGQTTTATLTVTVTATLITADLAIDKSGPVAVASGGALSYTLRVWNNGPGTAIGVGVVDTLPGGFTVTGVTCTASGTATCGTPTFTASSVTVTTGTLTLDTTTANTTPDGNFLTYTVTGTAPASGALGNTASLTLPSGVTDGTTTNNKSATVQTRVIDAVNDAAVTFASGSGGTVTVLGNDTNGGAAATTSNSVVTISSNGGLTGLGVNAGGQLVVPASAPAGSSTVTYRLCDVTVTSACDTATVTVIVSPPTPNLTLGKSGPTYARPSTLASVSPVVAASDSLITYTLTVTTTNANATGTTTVTDTLPSGLSWTAAGNYTATPGTWTCGVSGQVITCTTASTITVGIPQTITLSRVKVAAGTAAAPTFTNTATVSNAGESVADAAVGNSASFTTRLVLTTLSKEARNVTADVRDNAGTARFGTAGAGLPGEVLEYCIDTRNVGGADLPRYILTDVLSGNGEALTGVTTDAAYAGKAVKWTRVTPGNPSTASGNYTAAASDDAGTLNTTLTVDLGTLLAGETTRTCFQVRIR